MNLYEAYQNNEFSLTAFGIERDENRSGYFCTPVGADIIGWAGVDGIHYCTIREGGDMVFAVSPMNGPGEYVHPVAKNFADFLRLLLACKDNASLEQCWQWSQEQFDIFLGESCSSSEQKEAAAQVAELTGLEPMERPYTYIRDLQQAFDSGKLAFPEEVGAYIAPEPCVQAAPAWKVFYSGSIWGHETRERPGREIPVEKHFRWAGKDWYIPAVYSCAKGLVVECCMRVDAREIRAFMDRWALWAENDHLQNVTREQQKAIARDNPMKFHYKTRLMLNGKKLQADHGSAITYNPCMPDDSQGNVMQMLNHYGLDTAYGWVISRDAFRWATRKRPEIRDLTMTMVHRPGYLDGPRFSTGAPGDTCTFTNPVTGVTHTLTVLEYEAQQHHFDHTELPHLVFPSHFRVMSYILEPDAPDGTIRISDCAENERPREKDGQKSGGAAGIGIVFGRQSSGPADDEGKRTRIAVSSMHFEPVDKVEWNIAFREGEKEERTLSLL